MDGYKLVEGDYVACNKKLYRINKIVKTVVEKDLAYAATQVLELIHVKTTRIVKRKAFEVERLN